MDIPVLNGEEKKKGFLPNFLLIQSCSLFYPHISEISIMLHIILMISLSPSQAAIQAFCVAQHCSPGRRKETWARLLQARTEWWKTVMWQCCISSVWNDSKFLLSLGTHRGLGKTTTPTWQLLNISWRPLDVASQIYGRVSKSQGGWPVHSKWQEQKAPLFVLCMGFV